MQPGGDGPAAEAGKRRAWDFLLQQPTRDERGGEGVGMPILLFNNGYPK